MNIFKREVKEPKIWGENPDGTKYIEGITVADLKSLLSEYPDNAEVCMAVCPKKYWNGGGYMGKLKTIESGIWNDDGTPRQIWLKGGVIDSSME